MRNLVVAFPHADQILIIWESSRHRSCRTSGLPWCFSGESRMGSAFPAGWRNTQRRGPCLIPQVIRRSGGTATL